jgi:hypothetical protein
MVVPSNPDWVARFGEHLLQLRPSMSAIMAAALAIEAHRHEPDGSPEKAAERFHADHPEPGRRGAEVEPRPWSEGSSGGLGQDLDDSDPGKTGKA